MPRTRFAGATLAATFSAATAAVVLSAALLAAVALPARAQSVIVVPGLKVGVATGERDAAAKARLEPFRRRIAIEIGSSVTIVPYADGLTLIDAIATGRVDYAVLSASAYAMAWRVCGCVEPLVAPRSIDGTMTYRSILLVKQDSPAKRVEDLDGRSAAAADARSVAGRLFPFAELAAAGFDPETRFGRIETTTGPEAAVRLLVAGKVDAAFAWSTLEGDMVAGYDRGTLTSLVARKVLSMSDVRILWRSAAIPHGPHAVSKSMMPSLKNRLRDALLHLREEDPVAYEAIESEFGGGFTTAQHGAYEPLLSLVAPKSVETPKPAPAPAARPPG